MAGVIYQRLLQIPGRLLDLVFPAQCVACQAEGAFLCQACQSDLPQLAPPYCLLCATPMATGGLCSHCQASPSVIRGIRSPFLMEGRARAAVHALKYNNLRALAAPMGKLMARYAQDMGLAADVIVPVPLHPRRERHRGYNQSHLLAIQIGRLLGWPVEAALLAKTRNTAPQVEVASIEERLRNVDGAFAATRPVTGHTVLLIDDVCTTGATLEACATALRDAGAATVWGLTFAR